MSYHDSLASLRLFFTRPVNFEEADFTRDARNTANLTAWPWDVHRYIYFVSLKTFNTFDRLCDKKYVADIHNGDVNRSVGGRGSDLGLTWDTIIFE